MSLLNNYGFWGTLQLVYFKIRTLLLFPHAKIIRFPIDVRGKKYMKLGKGFTTGFGCRVEAFPQNKEVTLTIGDNFQMNDYVHITAAKDVRIGNNVLLASKIYISDCTHGSYAGNEQDSHPDAVPAERPLSYAPVVIEDNVWLGEFVSVLPGVTIGKGTIVGANSVVSRNLPPYVIAVGSPAKPIKKFNFEAQKWEKIQ